MVSEVVIQTIINKVTNEIINLIYVLQIVGGMTWCIETCNFEVDVDLLFNENLTIGQKMLVHLYFLKLYFLNPALKFFIT